MLVRDVADVREGAAFKRGEGSRSGKPAVIVGVQKQPGANTIEVTARLDRALDTLQQELPRGMTIDRRIFRQADFIEVAVDNVVRALRDGGILVVVIVLLFLANLRASAITLTAIPLSLAAAVLALRAFGASINTMTLGGMAIAIGALVDDAIIDVENVVRRLRENQAQPEAERLPAATIVRDATLEIRSSIVFATVIIVLVFLPVFGLAGVEGRLLTPLAFAYIVALLASLAVAIVVTPALCVAFLPERASIQRGHDGWLTRVLKARLRACCRSMLDHPAPVIAVSAVAAARGRRSALTRAGTAFLPEFHEGSLTVQANTLPGTSLAKSDEIGRRVEQILLAQPEVVATARRTGRAEYDEHVQGVEAAEIDVGLRRDRSAARGAAGRAAARNFRRCPARTSRSGSRSRTGSITCCRARAPTSPSRCSATTSARCGGWANACAPAMRGGAGRGRPVARAADGRAVRAVRPEPPGDRAVRPAPGRRRRSHRDELRRRDRRADLRSRHRFRS